MCTKIFQNVKWEVRSTEKKFSNLLMHRVKIVDIERERQPSQTKEAGRGETSG